MVHAILQGCTNIILIPHVKGVNNLQGNIQCHRSSIECHHSWHKQFWHKLFFSKKICVLARGCFDSFIFATPVPTRGSCCFIVLSLLHRGCVLEESGTFSQDEHWLLRHRKPYRPNICRKLLVRC